MKIICRFTHVVEFPQIRLVDQSLKSDVRESEHRENPRRDDSEIESPVDRLDQIEPLDRFFDQKLEREPEAADELSRLLRDPAMSRRTRFKCRLSSRSPSSVPSFIVSPPCTLKWLSDDRKPESERSPPDPPRLKPFVPEAYFGNIQPKP